MAKAPVEPLHIYRLLNPAAVVLVTVGDETRDNLFAVGWNMPVCDDPPVVALLVAREHFSWPFIERTREFGLNIPDARLLDAVYGCGKTTGESEPDKFGRFGLTRAPATQIGAPLVAEAVACLECRVRQVLDVEECALVLADVLCAVAEEEHFRDGAWSFDDGLQLLHHLDGPRFCVSERLALARRPG